MPWRISAGDESADQAGLPVPVVPGIGQPEVGSPDGEGFAPIGVLADAEHFGILRGHLFQMLRGDLPGQQVALPVVVVALPPGFNFLAIDDRWDLLIGGGGLGELQGVLLLMQDRRAGPRIPDIHAHLYKRYRRVLRTTRRDLVGSIHNLLPYKGSFLKDHAQNGPGIESHVGRFLGSRTAHCHR